MTQPKRKQATLLQQALLRRILPGLGRRGIQCRLRAQRELPRRRAPSVDETPYQPRRGAGTFRRRNAMKPYSSDNCSIKTFFLKERNAIPFDCPNKISFYVSPIRC